MADFEELDPRLAKFADSFLANYRKVLTEQGLGDEAAYAAGVSALALMFFEQNPDTLKGFSGEDMQMVMSACMMFAIKRERAARGEDEKEVQ